ncbi:MAG: hypothetical protein DYG93_07255 [Leptolyngbya sp. PLA2]|nr:hypothetical protein [Leptolyngbya sp.]MCE7971444.1 hypothetical protein [Leptolyngbya sp. PL-A2]MCQ3940659.1 hypothetical protein [cyanobacterium CYA1]MCZ7632346.1 hypothetical protein [Phycisphaerales bacterium]GIK20104.1 MAG: hypothetical protein BroJett004_22680 [Planctomycetota bacterium]
MKGVLGWVKSHLVVVICTAVVVVSLPLGFVFSSRMNAKIREAAEKEGNDQLRQIQNARVSYVIPSLLPDERPVELARQAPNAALTAWVKEQRDRRAAEASGVMRRAVEFNRRGHRPLVQGLFPDPPSDATQQLRLKGELLNLLAGDSSGDRPSLYETLFAEIGAGSPPSPERVFESVRDVEERERERLLADSPTGQLTAEQQAKLTEQLVNRRIGEYQRRAREISVYADLTSLDRTGFDKRSSLLPPPRVTDAQGGALPDVAELFQWQWDAWLVGDLLSAVARANTSPDGDRQDVENAVVKRIEKISVEDLPLYGDAKLPRLSAPEGSVPLDRSTSVTGRVSSETNKLYDVRRAKMTVVVSSERLPVFLDALGQTNMITVLSVNLSEVDVWADLQKGYFYGREPVVRAELELETLWLRSWTGPLMPRYVRQRLGVELTGEPG